jgi:NTE family protein
MLSSYTTIAVVRYNAETMALLQESFRRWTDEIRTGRCPPGQISREPGSCGDIEFYLVEVRFGNHRDKAEAEYLALLPTAFRLSDEEVDRLKAAARKILTESDEFRKLLRDLNAEGQPKSATMRWGRTSVRKKANGKMIIFLIW